MISLFRYLNARSRLSGIRKTIKSLGGSDDCNPLLLAQEEMTENETTYYWYGFLSESIYTLIIASILISGYVLYEKI